MAVQANELRIGNWVKMVSGQWVKIEFVNQMDDSLNFLYPIPLTPEILEKAGFEDVSDPEGSKAILYKRGLFYISFVLDGCAKISLPLNSDESKPRLPYFLPCYPTHLHQLQNLYFALTGQELEIKL